LKYCSIFPFAQFSFQNQSTAGSRWKLAILLINKNSDLYINCVAVVNHFETVHVDTPFHYGNMGISTLVFGKIATPFVATHQHGVHCASPTSSTGMILV